ncbi:MAG: cellulase family glycosylhydrolase [Acidobacteriia bacterium]|nr:cellulase family glycosylhydrolase [Terriglobia bacterium]
MRPLLIAIGLFANVLATAQTPKWSEKEANDWYAKQPWLVGSNYIPADAINQLEMWQAETFDTTRIDMELGWAENLGMNTMRVFLHDLLWQQDPSGFRRRIDRFLGIAKKHKIRPILVLFDSCWYPFPEVGIQRLPRPGVHNSGWMQSPGAKALTDPAQQTRLLAYVQEVVLAFSTDDRILAWDLWNEPDNTNGSSYGSSEPRNKVDLVRALLPKVYEYARAGLPTQPLTSGLWKGGDWSSPEKLDPVEKIQMELSDIVSFHNYGKPDEFKKRIQDLQAYHRPILATEYMARTAGSTFQGILPIAKEYRVAAYNWGFAAGKTQTWLPWDSWQHPYTDRQPAIWFHDIYFSNGEPYQQEEVDFIRGLTGGKSAGKATARR